MNYLDFVLISTIILMTIRGIFRGLISELTVLISVILGFVITITFLSTAVQWLSSFFPELPEFLIRIFVFLVLFLAINLIVRMIGHALNKFAKITFLQPINRIAGGLFAFLKITLLISIILLLIEFIPNAHAFLKSIGKEESRFYCWIRDFAPNIYHFLSAFIPGSEQLRESLKQTLNQADSTAREMSKPF